MACVSNSTPPESSQTLGSSWHAASEAPSSSSKSSKSSVSSLVSSSPSASSSSSQPRLWSPRFASSPSPPAPPVPFYFRFSPAERAFLGELTLLNGVIDRILPMLNRNPEPSLLSALCDYACRLITRSGCSLCQRTFYVFRALYRETSAAETRPYLVRRATAEVVDYIRQHFSAEWQQKKRNEKEKEKEKVQSNSSKPNTQDQPPPPQQKQSLDELLSIVVNVLGLYIDDPLCAAGFGPLTAVLQQLGLLRDKHLTSLFVFSPAEARVMRRAIGDGDGDDKEN